MILTVLESQLPYTIVNLADAAYMVKVTHDGQTRALVWPLKVSYPPIPPQPVRSLNLLLFLLIHFKPLQT